MRWVSRTKSWTRISSRPASHTDTTHKGQKLEVMIILTKTCWESRGKKQGRWQRLHHWPVIPSAFARGIPAPIPYDQLSGFHFGLVLEVVLMVVGAPVTEGNYATLLSFISNIYILPVRWEITRSFSKQLHNRVQIVWKTCGQQMLGL